MTPLRTAIALLFVAAGVVLVGGLLWNACEQRQLKGDDRPETAGLLRLGRFMVYDAGLLIAIALGFYLWSLRGS